MGQIAKAELGSFMDGKRGDVLSFEVDFSLVGLDQADRHVEGSRFAGSVGSEEADYFSGIDVEAKVVHDGFAAVAFDEVFHFEKFHK